MLRSFQTLEEPYVWQRKVQVSFSTNRYRAMELASYAEAVRPVGQRSLKLIRLVDLVKI